MSRASARAASWTSAGRRGRHAACRRDRHAVAVFHLMITELADARRQLIAILGGGDQSAKRAPECRRSTTCRRACACSTPSGSLIVSNQRYAEIYGSGPGAMCVPGPPLRTHPGARAASLSVQVPSSCRNIIAERLAARRRREPWYRVNELRERQDRSPFRIGRCRAADRSRRMRTSPSAARRRRRSRTWRIMTR